MMMSGTSRRRDRRSNSQLEPLHGPVWAHHPRHPKHAEHLLENKMPLSARCRINGSRKYFMLENGSSWRLRRERRKSDALQSVFWIFLDFLGPRRVADSLEDGGRPSPVPSGPLLIGCTISASDQSATWRDRDPHKGHPRGGQLLPPSAHRHRLGRRNSNLKAHPPRSDQTPAWDARPRRQGRESSDRGGDAVCARWALMDHGTTAPCTHRSMLLLHNRRCVFPASPSTIACGAPPVPPPPPGQSQEPVAQRRRAGVSNIYGPPLRGSAARNASRLEALGGGPPISVQSGSGFSSDWVIGEPSVTVSTIAAAPSCKATLHWCSARAESREETEEGRLGGLDNTWYRSCP
ncbi:hypothetical protein C8Q79DRAFT_786085 [Trametes meyenii]|nr:hypothetical protein C8Q79DRAFT_786085 [Trametes meyenii]